MRFGKDHVLEIEAPPEVVWEVLTDFPRYAEWNPFVVDCKSTLEPGSPIDLRVKLFTHPQDQREWMTEHVPGRRFAYRMKPFPLGALSSARSHDIESAGPRKTRYRSHFELRGWLVPVVRVVLGARLARGFDGMSNAIKDRAETLAQRRSR